MEPNDLVSSLVIRRMLLDGSTIRLEAHGIASDARCPSCGSVCSRVHGRYVRRPIGLPWRGCTVRLVVTVRRFRCDHRRCRRATFAEVLDHLPRRARRTAEVTALMLGVVNAAGGERGARLARSLGVPTSPNTLLLVQRAAEVEPIPTPRVLGVDDLAIRRGHVYATLFVDLETRRPIDLVDGRDAAVLAAWLREHPGVEIIVRDRAEAYADGARAGAPSAVQVADRFHLVQNASTALKEVLRARRRTVSARAVGALPTDVVMPAAPRRPPSASARRLAEQRAARLARWETVHRLRAQGRSLLGIANELGMGRATVRGLLASPLPPHNQVPPRPAPLASPTPAPFVPYLQDQWQAGMHNVRQLVREIVALGYPGSASLVRQAIATWRPPRPRLHLRPAAARDPPPMNARWMCLRAPDRLDDGERAALGRLLADDPRLATGYDLHHRFRRLIATRDHAALDRWLIDAGTSGRAAFEALANGIQTDRAAVDAALATPWSTGPVEGHVHRVKLIKRAGYGRAKLDLLRTRVLQVA
jgi:transposase